MKSCEALVSPQSDYYVYTPSMTARDMFLYPLQCGHFLYEPGYQLCRDSYDNYLCMYLEKGELTLEYEGTVTQISAGSFVLIDCNIKHLYRTDTGCACLWCHFDGLAADSFYKNVVSHLKNVFRLPNPYPVESKLRSVYDIFRTGRPVREASMHKYLTDILVSFLLASPYAPLAGKYAEMAGEIISYINEHFSEDVSVEKLADLAGLSQYHFIRTFKKETGFTPHEYLINTRIMTACYLLKNSTLPVKDICFNTGFSCESVFCSAFRKHQGMTPAQYRALKEN